MATTNPTSEKLALDRSDGSATIALYRAVLGPVHTDYYLKAFTRFDATGKTTPLWNWSAALLSLNWLLFRRLWLAALGFTGGLAAAVLLLAGIARLVFQVPVEAQWLLAGGALLLAIGLPGALGNAWLYAACNRRMERALVASATLEDACAALAAQAPGRKHLGVLLAGNVALAALLLAGVLAWPAGPALPLDGSAQARSIPIESVRSGLATQSVGVASTAQPGASEPASGPVSASRVSQGVVQAPAVPAAVPAPSEGAPAAARPVTSEPVPVATAMPVAKAASAASVAPVATTAPAARVTPAALAAPAAAATPAVVPNEPAVAATEKKPASTRETRAEKAAKREQKKLQAQKEKAAKAAKTAKGPLAPATGAPSTAPPVAAAAADAKVEPVASAATGTGHADEKFLINVGLFADANNARNALAKLQDAGLSAQSQEIKSAKGVRTRVRVGPFETQAEADRVADKIRALQLEAVVFKP